MHGSVHSRLGDDTAPVKLLDGLGTGRPLDGVNLLAAQLLQFLLHHIPQGCHNLLSDVGVFETLAHSR